MSRVIRACVASLAVCLLATAVPAQITIYVDGDASGADDGTSWSDAYNDLQDALAVATSGDDIRIAEGTHRPDQGASQTPGDRAETFLLPAGVSLCGGHAGAGEPNPDLNDPDTYVTTLDGDLDGDDAPGFANRADNSLHVVTIGPGASTVSIHGVLIRGGNANITFSVYQGGGVLLLGAPLNLSKTSIVENEALVEGGGVYCPAASTITILDCLVSDNRVLAGSGTFASGAGLYLRSGTVDIRGSSFDRNCIEAGELSNSSGAGAYLGNSTSGTVAECSFSDNSTVMGASGTTFGTGLFISGTVKIRDCSVSHNTSAGPFFSSTQGGGAALAGGFHLSNSTFSGNDAHGFAGGGGLLIVGSGMTIQNCLFSGNITDNAGGGLSISSFTTGATVSNCTFSNNTAGATGGGIFVEGGQSGSVANCVVWGNSDSTGTGEGAQVTAEAPVSVTFDYCDIGGLTGGLGGTGNIGSDPLFVDADGADNIVGTEDDDLRLSAGSPCIDAGDNTAVLADTADLDCDGDTSEATPVDLDDNMRFYDDLATADTGVGPAPVVDMGAYEFGSGPETQVWSVDLGNGLAGTYGIPSLSGEGRLCGGESMSVILTGALESSTAWLCVGVAQLNSAFKGGVLVPDINPPGFFTPLPTNGSGNLTIPAIWPFGIPSALTFYFQYWVQDAVAPVSFSASNAISGTTP